MGSKYTWFLGRWMMEAGYRMQDTGCWILGQAIDS